MQRLAAASGDRGATRCGCRSLEKLVASAVARVVMNGKVVTAPTGGSRDSAVCARDARRGGSMRSEHRRSEHPARGRSLRRPRRETRAGDLGIRHGVEHHVCFARWRDGHCDSGDLNQDCESLRPIAGLASWALAL